MDPLPGAPQLQGCRAWPAIYSQTVRHNKGSPGRRARGWGLVTLTPRGHVDEASQRGGDVQSFDGEIYLAAIF